MNIQPARAAPVAVEVLRANIIVGRARSRLSQQQLADRAGVSRPTISRIERAIGDVSLDVIERIARALDVAVHELLRPSDQGPITERELARRAAAPASEFVDAEALLAAVDEAEGRPARRFSAAGRPRLAR